MEGKLRLKKRSFIYTLSFSVFAMFCIASSCWAQKNPTSLTVTSTVYPPFIILEANNLTGIDFDIAREAGSRLGINIHLKLMPWGRINRNLKSEVVGLEAVAAFFKTKERTQYLDYTNIPLHVTAYKLFVRNDSDIQLVQLGDIQKLKGKTIGLNHGFKTTAEIQRAKEIGLINIEEVKTDKQNFLKLASGRIDAVLTNYHVGSYTIKTLKLADKIRVLPLPLSETPAYLVLAKSAGLEHLVPKFNEVLKNMIEDGTFKKIYKRYGITLRDGVL